MTTPTVEHVQPNADQLARLSQMIRRLRSGVVPTTEVRDLEDQVPQTYVNLYHVGGKGYVPYLENHHTDTSIRLDRVGNGYTAK